MAPTTLYDKIFASHIVRQDGDTSLIYIDRHIVHEVTSPQAFEGLRNANRKVRRPDNTLVTSDHNVPTSSRKQFKSAKTFIDVPESRQQVVTLEDNVAAHKLTYFGLSDVRQGIVHVIGPEQGFTVPGTTIVCGDSHTATHGAFGALAFGIGTSEVEHVLATQTLLQRRAKNMRIRVTGQLGTGVTSKDLILHIIGRIGTAGGTGCVMEYCGDTIERLSMEARMSMCNMSIEGGARAGLIAPDETCFAYLKGRPLAPTGQEWDDAVAYWRTLKSDADAKFDVTVDIDATQIEPTVTWGTSPEDVVPIGGKVPDPASAASADKRKSMETALEYMGLKPNTPMSSIAVDKVFIGSCTNSRIEDLRAAADVVRGRKVADNVYAMVVPGSGLVKQQAEREGLDRVFKEAGFDWREAGCSMCLGMNPDMLKPQERCASTSNRNFQNRQGPQGRTHLMSPAMAAAAAVSGHLTDVRQLGPGRPASPSEGASTIANAPVEERSSSSQSSEDAQATPNEASDAPIASAGGPVGGLSSSLPKFTTLSGLVVPCDRSNVDTDMIIQAKHLKTIKRTGLGQFLFEAIRFDRATGKEIPDEPLNQAKYKDARILVARENFGCGSSREHAGWSLLDRGIRCVVASSFGDIFANNYQKNGCLAVQLKPDEVEQVFAAARDLKTVEIDLPKQVVRLSSGKEFSFTIDEFRKHYLIEGLDDISLTLKHDDDIRAYEAKRSKTTPWLDGMGRGEKLSAKVDAQGRKLDW